MANFPTRWESQSSLVCPMSQEEVTGDNVTVVLVLQHLS